MRKLIVVILGLFLIIFFTGCAINDTSTNTNNVDPTANTDDDSTTDNTNNVDPTTNTDDNDSNLTKSIVIYFSRTNNTEKVADFIIEITNSDKYEIEAKIPYTDDDIKYYTDCRADREQKDPTARPEIGSVDIDLSNYDIIYLGYPIWHGQAPKIMYTFVEKYNLENKTIVPFCTSASSPIGSSAINLSNLTNQGTWLNGKRFSSSATKEEVNSWLDSLPIMIKEEKDLVMEIDGVKVDVIWEDNDSVKELMEYAKDGLSISMNIYGGFEQVGSLGKSIKNSDTQMSTNSGDIVLYNSSNIVVFFGTNSWSYTKLGHINLNSEELNTLLNKDSVTLLLKVK